MKGNLQNLNQVSYFNYEPCQFVLFSSESGFIISYVILMKYRPETFKVLNLRTKYSFNSKRCHPVGVFKESILDWNSLPFKLETPHSPRRPLKMQEV